MLGEQPTLSVDAQMGDRRMNIGKTSNIDAAKNEGIITVASDSSKDSKRFDKADTVNIHEGPDWGFIVLLVLGWILPTPLTMCREAVRFITRWTKQTPVGFV